MFSPPGDTRWLLQSNDNASDHRSDNELKGYDYDDLLQLNALTASRTS